jgi:hypothetical protein
LKPKKQTSAHLPIPSHARTASSPSKLFELGTTELPSIVHKKHASSIEHQKSTDSDRSDKSGGKLETKKLSFDSHVSDKSAKRTMSECSGLRQAIINEKMQKRSLDEMRLSTRTPSTRSFVLNTPETPKGNIVATPELLAELLKGSSEKLVNEERQGNNSSDASTALPTAVLKCLVSRGKMLGYAEKKSGTNR